MAQRRVSDVLDDAHGILAAPYRMVRRAYLRHKLTEPFGAKRSVEPRASESTEVITSPPGLPALEAADWKSERMHGGARAPSQPCGHRNEASRCADAWLRSGSAPKELWVPRPAMRGSGVFKPDRYLPVLAASPATDPEKDDGRPFSWVMGPGKVPLIPTVMQHIPRPEKPLVDLNELMNNCAVRGVMSFVVGGALGAGMGVLIGSWQLSGHQMEPGMTDPTKLTAREALREMVTMMKSKSISWARNFAIVGGVFSVVECILATVRGRHDIKNPVIGGCITGAALAYNQGPVAILMGCGGFAAFSIVIEQFMHGGGGNPMMMLGEENDGE